MVENVFENKIINIVETKGVAAYPWLDVINKIIGWTCQTVKTNFEQTHKNHYELIVPDKLSSQFKFLNHPIIKINALYNLFPSFGPIGITQNQENKDVEIINIASNIDDNSYMLTNIEINPEDFEEICEVSIVDAKIKVLVIHGDFVKNGYDVDLFRRELLPVYDYIVVLSEALKNQISEIYPDCKDKFVSIPNFAAVDEIKDLDVRVREVQVRVDGLKAEKNRLSGEIGKLMKEGKKDEAEKIKADIAKTADEIAENEKEFEELTKTIIGKNQLNDIYFKAADMDKNGKLNM